MESASRSLGLTSEVELRGLAGELFLAQVVELGLPHVRIEHWPTTARSLELLAEPLLRVREEGRDAIVVRLGTSLAHLSVWNGWVYAELAAADEAALGAALAELKQLLPSPDPSAKHEVNVTFWTYTPHGPQPSSRTIAVPEWDEIRENYSARTRAGLDAIMRDFQPAHGGQLVLWHGLAGTGKTFGLRALAWEWRGWCELHYIVDPDSFFGAHADYLMNVLLQPAYSQIALGGAHPALAGEIAFLGAGEEAPEAAEKAWKVLVLEDTGELLAADARMQSGQGLSRFLNVVDGLIGQGLRVLVLVTTNEELRKLHPAVARPGRCAANIEFEALSAEEVAAWLERRGVTECPGSPAILASLYALAEGFDAGETARTAGFAAR